jgi:amino acid adenylation domain-containing protein
VAELAVRVEEMRRAELPVLPPVVPVERTRALPLSFAQERLWFIDRLEPGSALYNIPVAWRLGGALDEAALERSLGEIVRRHESLRTVFREVDAGAVQVIAPFAGFAVPVEDLSGLSEADREAAVGRRAGEEAARPFDLSAGPLFRAALLRLGEEDHVLLLSMHHIVSDGWSFGVLFRELAALYEADRDGAAPPLAPLPVQYADFAVWQREHLRGPVLARQLAYWKDRLTGAPALLELPTDRPRPAVQTYRGAQEAVELPAGLLERLEAVGRAEGATLYMVLLGAFQVLLGKYAGTEDVVVGSPIAGRTRGEVEGLIGFFVNMLPLRTDLGDDPSFRQLLRRVRETTLGAYEHQEVPFERLVEELQPERSLSYAPLFQAVFALNDGNGIQGSLPGVRTDVLEAELATTKFDLTLALGSHQGRLSGGLAYGTDLFDRATVLRMIGHLQRVLEQIASRPEARLSEMTLLGDAERSLVVEEWNRTEAEYPAGRCIHQLFEAQAERTPEAEALVIGDESLTFRELNERANQLAHSLIEKGVGPDTLVGVSCSRSFELVTGILATLKAGGAYVPFDPSYPADRLEFMIEDSGVDTIITTQPLRSRLPLVKDDARTIVLADRADLLRAYPKSNPVRPELTPSNLAYVIYTSGSTGTPKGVLVEHRGLVNLVNADIRTLRLDGKQRVLHCLSLSFDAGTEHLFNALCGGATTYMVEPGSDLMEVAVEQRITQLRMPVAVLEAQPETPLPYLNTVVVGGEACSRRVVETWSKQARFFNQYGPTECTVTSTMAELTAASDVLHMGRFVENQYGYVVDANMNRCPIGVPGELLIGGAGVARGYLNRPELTADRFIKDPFSNDPGARVYRTGDWVRLLPDGNVEFVGRRDAQLKIRGYRIELGEIEQSLLQQEGVQDVIVIARGEGRDKRLCAYVIPSAPLADEAAFIGGLQQALRAALPEPMVPSDFVVLASFPLTPNGKVDQPALPEPGLRRAAAVAETMTPVQQTIATVWCEYLKIAEAGLDDEFFDIGGDSLDLMSVVAELKRRGLVVTVRQALENKTIRELAAAIAPESAATPSLAAEYLVRLNDGAGSTPLFVVHPFGGKIDCYTGLAAELNDVCTVYGIQAPFNFNHDLRFDTLEQLAASYVEAIQHVQAEGPYRLAGWSAGGTIAYEIARLLEERGQSVDYLGLFDAPPPGVLVEQQSDREYLLTAARYADTAIRTKVEGLALPDEFDASLKAVVDLIIEDEGQSRLTRAELETALRFGVNFSRSHGTSRQARLTLHGMTTLYLAVDEKTKVIPAAAVEALVDSPLRTVPIASNHTHLMSGAGLRAIAADAREQLFALAESAEAVR